jgi:hypothetical protein
MPTWRARNTKAQSGGICASEARSESMPQRKAYPPWRLLVSVRYLEDYAVGQTFRSGPVRIDRTTTFNQNDEVVQVQVGNLIVPRKSSSASRTG